MELQEGRHLSDVEISESDIPNGIERICISNCKAKLGWKEVFEKMGSVRILSLKDCKIDNLGELLPLLPHLHTLHISTC